MVVALVILSTFLHLVNADEPVFDLPHRGCFYPDWAQYRPGLGKFTAKDVDPKLCTYIVVAFGKIVNNSLDTFELNDPATFATLGEYKKLSPNLKIFLSVGGRKHREQLSAMGTVPEARRAFVDSVVVQSRTWGIDGIDIDWDWEFSPNHNDLTSFLILLRDLRRAFESDAVSRNFPRLCLSATLHWTPQLAASNVSAFNSYIDLANVQAYDQAFTAYGKTLSHHAPLFKGPLGLESSSNMVSILNAWAGRGILKSKMVAGLPLFGRGWLLKTAAQHNLADPAGELIPGPEPGAWFFNEICQKIVTDKAVVVMDQNIGASYAYSDTWWTGYNNQETLATKARWAISNGYAGIYVWEISQDDFRGSCNMGKYPLLNAIRNAHPLFTAPQVKESGIVLSSASTSSPFNSGAISLSLAVFSIITKCFSFY